MTKVIYICVGFRELSHLTCDLSLAEKKINHFLLMLNGTNPENQHRNRGPKPREAWAQFTWEFHFKKSYISNCNFGVEKYEFWVPSEKLECVHMIGLQFWKGWQTSRGHNRWYLVDKKGDISWTLLVTFRGHFCPQEVLFSGDISWTFLCDFSWTFFGWIFVAIYQAIN